MEFLLGVIVGAVAIFCLFFWLGTSPRFKHLDTSNPGGPNYYHPQPVCQDGHKWCQEHAAQGKFHCTVCPYVMHQE